MVDQHAPSWNPLACSDTSMRPNVLLLAKLAFLLLVLGGTWRSINPYAPPLLPGFELLRDPALELAMYAAFWISGVCLLFNRGVRVSAGVLGAVVLLIQLGSTASFRPHAWLCASTILLCALENNEQRPHLLRWLPVLAHAAIFLGATRGPGWTSLIAAEPWMYGDFVHPLARGISHLIPADLLTTGLWWLWLGAELGFTIMLALPVRKWAIWASLAFHTAIYAALGSNELALFTATLALTYLSFLRWPRTVVVVWPRACGLPRWLRIAFDRYDWDHRFSWPMPPDPDADLEIDFDNLHLTRGRAVCDLALYFPAFYFALFAAATTIHIALPPLAATTLNGLLIALLLAYHARPTIGRARAHLRQRALAGNTHPPFDSAR